MGKIHKPIPKTIKKDGPVLNKVQTKITKPNSAKEVVKKVKKTLVVGGANNVENAKTKGGALNKKKNELLAGVEQTVAKKKTVVQKSIKNGEVKKTQALEDVTEPIERIEPKKKTAAAKIQKPAAVKKSTLEKSPVESPVQQTVKKSVPKKNPTSVEAKKGISKKEQVVGKVQQPAKAKVQQVPQKHVAKKNAALELKPEENGKKLPQKKPAVAKDQQQVKKKPGATEVSESVKNVLPKKKLITATAHTAEQKPGKKPIALKVQDKVGKALQKKSNSKVQKKFSAEKKNKSDLKNKVRKNVGKILHKDQDEIVKPEKKKSPLFEPESFDENKFKNIVSLENIKKVATALKSLIEKEASEKKTPVFSDYKYFLNVACYKIPNCPKRMVKLNLKHAHVDINVDDVVLFVPDLQRGSRVDYEPTIQHYEDLLRQYGIENIKVMPFNQLKNEYSSFEAKRKLANIYDHFLCDGRIVGHVVGHCGKHFQKPRTTIHAVNLSNPKTYKKEIEHALKRTSFRQLRKGDLTTILVGDHRFTADQLAENIKEVVDQLKVLFPGGYANIRNLHIRTHISGTPAMPLYVSMSGAPDDVPNIIGPREQRMIKLKKQANEVLSKFDMSKTGDFVQLNKAQVKRKQQIRETRDALTSKTIENDEEVAELNPPAKKKLKKQVVPQSPVDSEVSDNDVDESAEDGEESGDDENVEASEEESEVDDVDDVDDEEDEKGSEDDE